MKSVELANKGRISLVAVLKDDDTVSEYLTCSFYDGSRRFGEQWDWGHYFGKDIEAAMEFYKEA